MPFKDIILFLHPTFGVLAMLAALWVFVETLNATDGNLNRIRTASAATAGLFALTWFFAGWFYTTWYGHGDQQIIIKGPVPWAHDFFMETKEHLFFIPLILAFLLPFVTRLRLSVNKPARLMTLIVAGLITLNVLSIEGAGAIINWGAKTALAQTVHTTTNSSPVQHEAKK